MLRIALVSLLVSGCGSVKKAPDAGDDDVDASPQPDGAAGPDAPAT